MPVYKKASPRTEVGPVKVRITGTEQRDVEETKGWKSWTAKSYTVYVIETISTLDSHDDMIPFGRKTY